MAESTSPKGSSGDFAKKVQRQLSRGKEKVLQKFGKSLETRDDQFDLYFQIFNDQQTDGNRIYKDLRNYINAVRDMREASRRLSQSLFDVYESDWAGEEDLGAIVEGEDLLWNDFEVKLLDQAVRTMESYVGQFPDMREKIAKRGRKLVDYDSSLRHLETLQLAKKRDDVKINKAKDEMKAAKAVYDGLNSELKEELPVLYDSRIGCYVTVFSSVSNLRDIFYKEMNTLNLDLQSVIKELQAQHPDKVFSVRGLQKYGSLRRRTLMSPKAWKTSFTEFHRNYSPRSSQRNSFRSSEKPRYGSLSRESSTLGVSSQPSPLDNPLSESRELDAASSHSEGQDAVAVGTSGNELKSEEDSSRAEGETGLKETKEEEKDGEKAPPSESSSELNGSCDSVSLELQLSAAHSGPLHIEEDDSTVTPDPAKPNGLVSGLNPDPKDLSTPQKDVPAGKEVSQDSKSTTV
ncbi:bridging integrator 2a [Austrofundulus limnaeus]|uniref:Bridging integrator 2 n=1 Tax=Austrofundulus limnaeus TaxID=52670 RepID=A0A2I4BVC4_AUSLI|nr:PREDICTED: bridging integrator 2 [Austrofundulus limnaeus]XP_013871705.1 PREDICTED: bridging integrator 2 [Austrofundulus limnaeus]XP_013871706.1 PREDICTED: bridging integrator 2 [Austrofundulus limnaeus]